MYISFAIIGIWTLFLSPIVHYHYLNEKAIFLPKEKQTLAYWWFNCRGIGNPIDYYKIVKGKLNFIHYIKIIGVYTAIMDVLLIGYLIEEYKDYGELLVRLFGVQYDWVMVLGALVLVVLFSVVLVGVAYPIFMRIDNFEKGLKEHFFRLAKIALVLLLIFNISFQLLWKLFEESFEEDSHFQFVGDKPFVRAYKLRLIDCMCDWLEYVLWGWAQQWLFLSCYSTMISRAVNIQQNSYGIYVVAAISAVFFATVHFPCYWLSLCTLVFGFFWAITFMNCRNLLVLGSSHGFLGTLTHKLLPIEFGSGPAYTWFLRFFRYIA